MLPFFETERLRLRERTLDDLDDCLEMDRDPEVVRYIPEIRELITGPRASDQKHRDFVKTRMKMAYPNGLGYWTIESKDNKEDFVGWVLLIPRDAVGPETEIGWRLKRKYWGRGYASEAAKKILHYAFDTVGLQRVVADIHGHNSGSIRVAEKIGLRLEKAQETPYIRYGCDNNNF